MVVPRILPEVAVMVVVPTAIAVARPLAVTVAVDVLDEVQATWEVTSEVVPSENVAVAANCWVAPILMLGLAGVMAMEDRALKVTVRVMLAEVPLKFAVMVAVPVASAVASPLLLIVATDVSEELQVTCEVKSKVVASE